MNRCRTSLALIATTAFLLAPAAQAQVREFPAPALRGVLQVTQPPDIVLDGKADRLSPGARILGVRNELVMSASIVGERLVVNYTREPNGMVHQVWLLNQQEAALKRPSATRERNFLFASEEDTRPKDDGKTPFHLLPKYGQ
ncbi:hypothetical protein [Pseudorhodoferax soli]|uniref:Uncharacterized protein n=1 Tax=Pseudorhodoferax soli TaxID=545864 RepID=A0A368Y2E4_9BURK|nr:hypothetical protein [Pseudorhodoferax soli]RCW74275.1 hypothetical protein DES41_102597 [Pseudorhodoferax soli]